LADFFRDFAADLAVVLAITAVGYVAAVILCIAGVVLVRIGVAWLSGGVPNSEDRH